MCNKVIFYLRGCGHNSHSHPHMIPQEYEILARVFTTAPSTSWVPYLDQESMAYHSTPGHISTARHIPLKKPASPEPATKVENIAMMTTSDMYRDEEELTADFKSSYLEPEILNLLVQRQRAAETASTSSRDKMLRRAAATNEMPNMASSKGVYIGKANSNIGEPEPSMRRS